MLKDAELPASMAYLPKVFSDADADCYERLTKLISSRE